jgi:hypothetical protein
MPCDLGEMLQRQFYFFGTYFLEEDILSCWEAAAKGAKLILDVGANAGIYSLAALAISPTLPSAFEPTPEIAARLHATAMLNGLDHLNVHEAAVLNKNGQAALKAFPRRTEGQRRDELHFTRTLRFWNRMCKNSMCRSVLPGSFD